MKITKLFLFIVFSVVSLAFSFSGVFSTPYYMKTKDGKNIYLLAGDSGLSLAPKKVDEDDYPDFTGEINDQCYIFWGNGAKDKAEFDGLLLPFSPIGLVDVNRDGKLDIVGVSVENNQQKIYVMYNQGNRQFSAPSLIFTPPYNYDFYDILDVDGDGNLDIVCSTIAYLERIYWGDNNNQFDPDRYTQYYPNLPFGILEYDFNNDGRLDLGTGNWTGGYRIYIQQPDKTFQLVNTLPESINLEFVDVNRDGKLDMVFNYDENGIDYVAVALGNGDGTFSTPHNLFSDIGDAEGTDYLEYTFKRCIPVDFNNDRKVDLIMTKRYKLQHTLYYLQIDENLNYETSLVESFSVSTYPTIFTDFDGDTNPDIAIVGTYPYRLMYGEYGLTLNITIDPPFSGYVVKSPDKQVYPTGSQVSLQAFSYPGYSFSGWSGDVNTSNNPITLTMDTDKNIKANFVASSGGGGGGGCFIATACFGNYNHPFVRVLREFRDRVLLKNSIGKKFVNWYYAHSPKYAEIIRHNTGLKIIGQILLLPFVFVCFVILNLKWIVLLTGIFVCCKIKIGDPKCLN
jgi:hypothetical protein